MNIQCVIFDCDGLMFETEIVSNLIWENVCREHGVQLPDDFFMHITGSGKKEQDAYIKSVPGVEECLEEIRKKRFDISIWGNCAKDSLNKKGLLELFQYLEKNKYKVAICSSSRREYVEALISTTSIPLKYDTIVCGDMVTKAKPDPEIFLTGAKNVGIPSENCLVLEDSKQGILAAHRANMHSVYIPDTIIPDDEMKKYIEFEEENLGKVIELLEKRKAK